MQVTKKYRDFANFLATFVDELNKLSGDGFAVLVEGKRDLEAMRKVGYRGQLLTTSSVKSRTKLPEHIVIMTDLDREGRQLAARLARDLTRRGIEISLVQRRRILVASRGVFRHIENLSRFSVEPD